MNYLIYLTIFLIPTYLIRFSLFGVPTNALEILVGFIFLTWFFAKFPIRYSQFDTPKLLLIGIFLLAAGLFFGTLFSVDIRASLGALKSWFIVPLVFALVARSVLVNDQQKKRALYALACSGVSVALAGLGYWLLGRLTFDGRLAAFYESPNMLAMYIAPTLLIAMQELTNNKQLTTNNKYGRLFLIALCALSLLFTRSIGAFIGIMGALGATILYARRQVWRKLWITFIVAIIVMGLLLPLSVFFTNPWQAGRSSLASRFMVWQVSAKIISQHWFFGIGLGTFQQVYLSQQKNFSPFLEWAIPHPHNIFLDTYLSAGLLGLAGLLLILCWFFFYISEEKESFVVSCLLLVVCYVIIHGAIDNTLWRNDMAIIFWLAVLVHI